MALDKKTMVVSAILLFAIGGIVFLIGLWRRPPTTTMPVLFQQSAATLAPTLPTVPPVQPPVLADPNQLTVRYANPQPLPGGILSGGVPPVATGASATRPVSWGSAFYGQQPVGTQTVPQQFTMPNAVPNPAFMSAPAQVPSPIFTQTST